MVFPILCYLIWHVKSAQMHLHLFFFSPTVGSWHLMPTVLLLMDWHAALDKWWESGESLSCAYKWKQCVWVYVMWIIMSWSLLRCNNPFKLVLEQEKHYIYSLAVDDTSICKTYTAVNIHPVLTSFNAHHGVILQGTEMCL